MNFVSVVCLIGAFYTLLMVSMTTVNNNFKSKLLFRFFPFIIAISLVIAAGENMGYINFNGVE